MTLSKMSSSFRHIWANSPLLSLFCSEIIGPNLVRTATHSSCCWMYLYKVGAEMFAAKCLAISLCSSANVISSSSSIFTSIKAAISGVILLGHPERCWSFSPRLVSHRFTHFLTVACEVLCPSDSKIVMIWDILFPSSDKDAIRYLW